MYVHVHVSHLSRVQHVFCGTLVYQCFLFQELHVKVVGSWSFCYCECSDVIGLIFVVWNKQEYLLTFMVSIKPNIHMIRFGCIMFYKSQCVHYKIVWSYIAYDVSYRIELLSIPYIATKSYATKPQRLKKPDICSV